MMHGYGYGWGWGPGWMMLMPLVWIGVFGLVLWALLQLVQRLGDPGPGVAPRRESAQEILDRRYASGEIDQEAYLDARTRLS